MRKFLATAMFAVLSTSASAGTVYYVDIVNSAPHAIVALESAPAGSGRFHAVLADGRTLPGNGASATVAIRKADAGCLRDLRARFADGHVAVRRDVDLCRTGTHRDAEAIVTRE